MTKNIYREMDERPSYETAVRGPTGSSANTDSGIRTPEEYITPYSTFSIREELCLRDKISLKEKE